ncbi:Lrp/AsnC family transcriptional regulator [Ilumatobacter coccineus]|uniref:Putative AsnC family transcriptional regulator n=1 Tax=Ilumatobacter coccineus (strain NBRC 103263 / KCTC 29153 / YM16-304) TaxID=1313172 RepID=A0A6C7E215_ILUCY|nr:Lrp/AsnC family transcriptional regulator [Ilumatobacter coccineus]BAN00883.1 putative AsnC family transcriptional regulator [Ilumatobacter coccineus YM16-304]
MDDVDRAILHQLQVNGRIANNELAAIVGLSPSSCLRRVRNLEATGLITGYVALLDRDAVGSGYEALVWVTLREVTRTTMLDFEAAIADAPNITEASRMMGQPDYLLRVVAADAVAFETLYMDVLATLPHVQQLTSQLAMKVVKRSTALPL